MPKKSRISRKFSKVDELLKKANRERARKSDIDFSNISQEDEVEVAQIAIALRKLKKVHSEWLEMIAKEHEFNIIYDACGRIRMPYEELGWRSGVPLFRK